MAAPKRLGSRPVSSFYASPLYDFLVPFRPAANQWVARYVIVLVTLIVRCCVAFGPYLGAMAAGGTQWGWMARTNQEPLARWYAHGSAHDCPPLAAFHRWLCGWLGRWVEALWFVSEQQPHDPGLVLFLRLTAIVLELAVYVPAVLLFVGHHAGKIRHMRPIDQRVVVAAVLIQPLLMLVDHGHGNYMCVLLGLSLLAMAHLQRDNYVKAGMALTAAILFHPSLVYYVPALAVHLVGLCVWPVANPLRVVSIGIGVAATILVVAAPFVYSALSFRVLWQLARVYQPLPPLACLPAVLPAVALVLGHPRKHLLPYSFAAVAWGCFLCSPSAPPQLVLVPLMPTTLMLCETDREVLAIVTWVCNMALFSLWPLLRQDRLVMQYLVMGALFNWFIGSLEWISRFVPKRLIPGQTLLIVDESLKRDPLPTNVVWRAATVSSLVAAGAIHVAECVFPTHMTACLRANVLLSRGCFLVFTLWVWYRLWRLR